MKVGILELGAPTPTTLAHTGEDIGQSFTRWLRTAEASIETMIYKPPLGELPTDPKECDGWILSGSRDRIVDPDPWQVPLEDWIRKAVAIGAPLFATCYGHQSIACALGGAVAANKHLLQVGPRTMTLNDEGRQLFAGRDQLTIMQSHNDLVSQEPEGFRLLAHHPLCHVEAMAFKNQILSFQGHPEFSDRMIEYDIEQSASKVPPEQTALARETFAKTPLDNNYLAQFVVDMFASHSPV